MLDLFCVSSTVLEAALATHSNLEKIQDPALRKVLENFGQAVTIRSEKQRCAREQIPYRPPSRRKPYSSPATPESVELTRRMTGERDLPDIPYVSEEDEMTERLKEHPKAEPQHLWHQESLFPSTETAE